MIIYIFTATLWTLVIYFLGSFNSKHVPPLFGIYQQRNNGYIIKFTFMYIFLSIKQFVNYVKLFLNNKSDGTDQVNAYYMNLEKKYNVENYSKAVDAVYFNGLSNSEVAVICGLARRPKSYCDAFLYLKVDGKDLLLSPNLPDTHLKQDSSEIGAYSVQGIQIRNTAPMRTWKLSYNGEMKTRENSKKVAVNVDLTWNANYAPFEYDTQMAPCCIARDMAREPWSSDYFNLLKKLHQTHYEQMGTIEGTATIDGKVHAMKMPCLRDRSFGPLREWRNFHRYVYHFMFLENGDCMAVGTVSEPTVLSHITIGYICIKENGSVLPVDYSDFKLYQHGENQILPKDYGYLFKAGGNSYAVKVEVYDEEVFYIGKEKEAKFYERWCDVEINGIRGRACAEWHYNNV